MNFIQTFTISILLVSLVTYSSVQYYNITDQINAFDNLNSQEPNDDLMQNLFKKLKKEQQNGINIFWKYQKGLFASNIKLNIVNDNQAQVNFGQSAYVPDNNMFVTSFVSYALLQIHEFGTLEIQESMLEKAINGILKFQNKNIPSDIPMYTFWPQLENENGQFYCWPENMSVAEKALRSLPQSIQDWLKETLGVSADFIEGFSQAFVIPADNDDTGINIALNNLLKNNQKSFPNTWKTWSEKNQNYIQLYQKYVKKYTYKPFSPTENENTIDPRTYMYIYPFLQQKQDEAKKNNRKPSLILFGTWLTNIEDQMFGVFEMPMDVNNIDVTVNTNALFGLINFLMENEENLEDIFEFYDQEIRQIINDVTDLIVWAVKSEVIIKRPDLSLTYYPSEYNFYWFVSRIGNYLNKFENIPFPEIERTKNQINDLLENTVTQQLLDLADGEIYWESFLGNFPLGRHHADRAFSTSMALNSLLDIWTYSKDSDDNNSNKRTLKWQKNTPQNIKDMIHKSINYLASEMSDDSTSVENTFFSGSVKSMEDLPFWYPQNNAFFQLIDKKNQKIQVKIPYDPKKPIENTEQLQNQKEDLKNAYTHLQQQKQSIKQENLQNLIKKQENYQETFKKQVKTPQKNLKTQQFSPKNEQKQQKIADGEDLPFFLRFQSYMTGFVESEQYEDWAQNYTWNGYPTPQDFLGYNHNPNYFPYWTSPAMTYAYSLLAFSKYMVLEN